MPPPVPQLVVVVVLELSFLDCSYFCLVEGTKDVGRMERVTGERTTRGNGLCIAWGLWSIEEVYY